MMHTVGKRILFLSSLICLLFAGKASFAYDQIDKTIMIHQCVDMQCDSLSCIWFDKIEQCYCSDCDEEVEPETENAPGDPSTTPGTVYSVGNEQFLCGTAPNKTSASLQCVAFPFKLKVLNPQAPPAAGRDKAVMEAIYSLKDRKSAPQVQGTVQTDSTMQFLQPTKSTQPNFRKSAPGGR